MNAVELIGVEWDDISAFLMSGVEKTRMGQHSKIDVARAIEILRDDDKLRKVIEVIKKYKYRDDKAANAYLMKMFEVHTEKFKAYKQVAEEL